jgi:hypothetical protein
VLPVVGGEGEGEVEGEEYPMAFNQLQRQLKKFSKLLEGV